MKALHILVDRHIVLKYMSIVISDEILQATQMSEIEFKQEIAILLFQQGKLTVGHASQLAGLDKVKFQKLLLERKIPLYSYDIADYVLDIENLCELGDLRSLLATPHRLLI